MNKDNFLTTHNLIQTLIEMKNMLEELVEDEGTNGEVEIAVQTEKVLKAVNESINKTYDLTNVIITPYMIPRILKEHLPDLTVEDFEFYLGVLKSRKEEQVKILEKEMKSYEAILNVFEGESMGKKTGKY